MGLLDDEYWNNRYLTNNFGWDIGTISTPLLNYFETLTNKQIKILIPGAGNSYEAEWLFNNGFTNTYVCDFAIEPLNNLKSRCWNFPSEQLLHLNFFDLNLKNFDLIIEQTFFCALNVNLRLHYFNKMADLLKDNGQLVGLLFNTIFESEKNGPPFGGSQAEYINLIEQTNLKLIKMEPCYNSITPRANKELFFILEK